MNFNRKFLTVFTVFLLAFSGLAQTNVTPPPAAAMVTPAPKPVAAPAVAPAPTPIDAQGVTREEVAENYLHIQEQIHEAQLAIEQNQRVAVDMAQSNAVILAARLDTLEDSVAKQRVNDAEAAHKTQQTTLFMAGAFGLVGLGIMLLSVYFQWRAFTQLAQISSQQHAALAGANGVHQLAAPGRATVEAANAQLLSVVGRLEQRINELEGGQRFLPDIAGAAKPGDRISTERAVEKLNGDHNGAEKTNGTAHGTNGTNGAVEKVPDLLAEGQRYLDAGSPVKALECFDQYLATHPDRADALVKRASALEKLGRDEEAVTCYNRAIAADGTLVIAHLHKGGLLNRLRRYDEALNCYEEALLAQEKKAVAR